MSKTRLGAWAYSEVDREVEREVERATMNKDKNKQVLRIMRGTVEDATMNESSCTPVWWLDNTNYTRPVSSLTISWLRQAKTFSNASDTLERTTARLVEPDYEVCAPLAPVLEGDGTGVRGR